MCAHCAGIYYAPLYDKLYEYREFIDNLPLIDEPEIFGMHDNANISFQAMWFKITVTVTITRISPKRCVLRTKLL